MGGLSDVAGHVCGLTSTLGAAERHLAVGIVPGSGDEPSLGGSLDNLVTARRACQVFPVTIRQNEL